MFTDTTAHMIKSFRITLSEIHKVVNVTPVINY